VVFNLHGGSTIYYIGSSIREVSMNGYSDFAKKVILEIETKREQAVSKELLKAHILEF